MTALPERPHDDNHPAVPGWVIVLGSCPSTNSWALDHINTLSHGDCVWTEHQTAGRGRDGRGWRSPPGVLTASFVVDLSDPQRPTATVPSTHLSLAAGLAIVHAIEDSLPTCRPMIKWPNDVLIDQRKVAGVLCETRARSSGVTAAVIGIGLNRCPQWDSDHASLPLASGRAAPIGLDECGPVPAALTLLVNLRRYLLEAAGMLAHGQWQPLLSAIRQRDALSERALSVQTPTATLTGTGAGLHDDGSLLLRLADRTLPIASGHITTID